MAPKPTFPLPRTDSDDRFTFGLMIDLADVLQTHGYPRPTTDPELIALQQAVFGFLYDTRDHARR